MIDIHQALRIKTELLCKGLYLDETLIDHYKAQGIQIDYGRRRSRSLWGKILFIRRWSHFGKCGPLEESQKNRFISTGK